jgi:hypothetical protein
MILVRLGGGPLGGSPVGTHCNATPRFEPVCSAVSGSLLSTLHSSSSQNSWFPTSGSAAGWRGGIRWAWVGPRHKMPLACTGPRTCTSLMSTNMWPHSLSRRAAHARSTQQAHSACTRAAAAQRCSAQPTGGCLGGSVGCWS